MRATFSVRARRVESFTELRRRPSFSGTEGLLIRRLVEPFNDFMPQYTGHTVDAHDPIEETPLRGQPVSMDG